MVLTLSHQLTQVESGRSLDSVIQFLFGILSIRKAFDLKHNDMRQPVQIQLPSTLSKSYL